MAYCCLILLGKSIQKVVFGELRISEQQVGIIMSPKQTFSFNRKPENYFLASERQILEFRVLQIHFCIRRGKRSIFA